MSATAILAESERRGIKLHASVGKLVIDAPRGSLDASFRADLAEHKADILSWLTRLGLDADTSPSPLDLDRWPWREALAFWSEDHLERWGELAGAIEADQGVARREAEGQAFLALVYEPQRFALGERDPFGPCPA